MARKKVIKIHSGDIFGDLTVIEPVVRESDPSHQYFRCKCTCGKEKIANSTSLLRGDLASCGCKWEKTIKSYLKERRDKTSLPIGYQSGQLTIIEDLGIITIKSKKEHCYRCKCSCGNEVVVRQYLLKMGQKSCGCTRNVKSLEKRLENCKEKREYPEYLYNLVAYEEERKNLLEKKYPYEASLHFYCSCCGSLVEKQISSVIRLNKTREEPIVLCLNCSNHRSSFEEEVFQYIHSLIPDIEIKRNVWNVLIEGKVRYEIDIYIPSKKIAIECNGDYFHSEKNGKPMLYHQNKFLLAEKQGIHLINLFQSYWNNNKDRIKQYFKDILQSTTRVFARKCKVKLLEKNQVVPFLNKNHLQGYNNQCNINYALLLNTEIVAVMSFNKTGLHDYKNITEGYYELVRYAVLHDYTIVGGSSKLLSQFEKDFFPNKLLSYSDNDFFLGTMYEKLGFTLESFSRPRYHWYLKDQTVRTRESCQLKYLSKQYPDLYQKSLLQEGNKETYIMTSLGAVKVWHSGNKRWVKKYNSLK